MPSLDEVIARLRRVDWGRRTDRQPSRVALMREFLRRGAAYPGDDWPFGDVVARVDPGAPDVPVPTDLLALGLPASVIQVVAAMLKRAGRPSPGPDPYEPLLLFFERGGVFTVENGMIDVDSAGIPFRDRARYERAAPFVPLARAALDALDAPAQWRALLDAPARPHDDALAMARHFAATLPPGDRSLLLVGVDEALCARVALSGAGTGERFCAEAGRLFTAVAALLGPTPDRARAGAALAVLTLLAAAGTWGAALAAPRFAASAWQAALALDERLAPAETLLVALLALASDRRDDARALLGLLDARASDDFDDPKTFVAWLAQALDAPPAPAEAEGGWRAFLCAFPGWLAEGRAEWRHLLVAARVASGPLLGVPTPEAAAALHRAVLDLAAP